MPVLIHNTCKMITGEKMSESKQYTQEEVFLLSCDSPLLFARALGLPLILCNLLKWRASSRALLVYLIAEIEERKGWIDLAHRDLASGLWPELSVESGKNKLARWLKAFDEDQYLSSFVAVERKPGRYLKKGEEKDFLPSKYRIRSFYDFARVAAVRLGEVGFFEASDFSLRSRKFREVCATTLIDLGAKAILPEMRDMQCVAKEQGKQQRRIDSARSGRVEMGIEEIRLIENENERLDVAFWKLLQTSEVLFDLVLAVSDLKEAEDLAARIVRKVKDAAEVAIARRRNAQRSIWAAQAERNKPKHLRFIREKKLVA